jgi:hypothetical protein
MSALDQKIKKIVDNFREDPRNKVFASEDVLILGIQELCRVEITSEKLREIIDQFEDGKLSGEGLDLYDGAVYPCYTLARLCFSEDPEDEDEEVDSQITWLENEDGSYVAEVRPY